MHCPPLPVWIWVCGCRGTSWKAEDNVGWPSPSSLFETDLICCCKCQIYELLRNSHSLHFHLGMLEMEMLHRLYAGSGDLNSGPHTCMASALPTEPFLQLLLSYSSTVLQCLLCRNLLHLAASWGKISTSHKSRSSLGMDLYLSLVKFNSA